MREIVRIAAAGLLLRPAIAHAQPTLGGWRGLNVSAGEGSW